MKLSIQKERDAMERLWKAREKQLEKVLLNAAHIRGSVEGIAGADSVNLNLVAFSRLYGLHGQVFAVFVITDAAAEAAVGLGILIAFFRNKETVNVDEVDLLKW